MEWILYVLLALAVVGDILLAVILAKGLQKNNATPQTIDMADDFVRAMTPVLQSETDLLAEQLRAMQGESARTTSATLRDFSAVLAENQRQSAATNTARLEAIDRAGAARQKAANDALLAQLTMMETRLKNLEDSNAVRMDSVRGAVVQGLNTIRADNNKKLDEIRGTVEEKLQDTLQQRINDSFKTVSAQLEQVYKGLGEMQNLAADVGSLKQVLSGVKTRGILGEVQLGAIWSRFWPPASMPAMWRPCRAVPTAWSMPSSCRARAARSGCPSTRNSPAIPTPICRQRRSGAMRPPWPLCARH